MEDDGKQFQPMGARWVDESGPRKQELASNRTRVDFDVWCPPEGAVRLWSQTDEESVTLWRQCMHREPLATDKVWFLAYD